MKYLIIGAGGTGGALGAYLARGGMDVDFLARGAHLQSLQSSGLRVIQPDGEFTVSPVRASDAEHYDGRPDIIFVCVKGYSLEGILPFLQAFTTNRTIVIPVLNLFGTGEKLQERLPDPLVTDGCIYVASEILSPGCILMRGSILRVVYGPRHPEEYRPELKEVEADLNACGISGILSDHIRRDALMKFSYVSPQGACGVYYDVPAGAMQRPGTYRDCFAALINEIAALAGAMGIAFQEDPVLRGLGILDSLSPEMTTSLQRDLKRGGPSELDGLVYEVVRLGERYGIDLPEYRKIAAELKRRGLNYTHEQ